jgi:hypothetical protein
MEGMQESGSGVRCQEREEREEAYVDSKGNGGFSTEFLNSAVTKPKRGRGRNDWPTQARFATNVFP